MSRAPRTARKAGPGLSSGTPECCSFYNGSYFKSDLAVALRYRDLIEFAPHYVATWINLPTGYVAIHIFQTNVTINFTPDMQLIIQEQFDNISRNFSFAARYRWEYEPGNELFAAIGQSALIPAPRSNRRLRNSPLRLRHTLLGSNSAIHLRDCACQTIPPHFRVRRGKCFEEF